MPRYSDDYDYDDNDNDETHPMDLADFYPEFDPILDPDPFEGYMQFPENHALVVKIDKAYARAIAMHRQSIACIRRLAEARRMLTGCPPQPLKPKPPKPPATKAIVTPNQPPGRRFEN